MGACVFNYSFFLNLFFQIHNKRRVMTIQMVEKSRRIREMAYFCLILMILPVISENMKCPPPRKNADFCADRSFVKSFPLIYSFILGFNKILEPEFTSHSMAVSRTFKSNACPKQRLPEHFNARTNPSVIQPKKECKNASHS